MGKVTLIQEYSQPWKTVEDLIEQFEKVTTKYLTADILDKYRKIAFNIKSGDQDEIFPFIMSFNMGENEEKGLAFCEQYTSQYHPKVMIHDGNVWETQY